jgi:hypothetical protein
LQLAADIAAGEDRGRRIRQQLRFALTRGRETGAALGFRGTLPPGGGESADDHCRDQEHDQLDHVLGVGDREAVTGRDEEVIERQHAEHRGAQRRELATSDRNCQNGE